MRPCSAALPAAAAAAAAPAAWLPGSAGLLGRSGVWDSPKYTSADPDTPLGLWLMPAVGRRPEHVSKGPAYTKRCWIRSGWEEEPGKGGGGASARSPAPPSWPLPSALSNACRTASGVAPGGDRQGDRGVSTGGWAAAGLPLLLLLPGSCSAGRASAASAAAAGAAAGAAAAAAASATVNRWSSAASTAMGEAVVRRAAPSAATLSCSSEGLPAEFWRPRSCTASGCCVWSGCWISSSSLGPAGPLRANCRGGSEPGVAQLCLTLVCGAAPAGEPSADRSCCAPTKRTHTTHPRRRRPGGLVQEATAVPPVLHLPPPAGWRPRLQCTCSRVVRSRAMRRPRVTRIRFGCWRPGPAGPGLTSESPGACRRT